MRDHEIIRGWLVCVEIHFSGLPGFTSLLAVLIVRVNISCMCLPIGGEGFHVQRRGHDEIMLPQIYEAGQSLIVAPTSEAYWCACRTVSPIAFTSSIITDMNYNIC